jgi:hypothetical protein
MAKHRHKVAKHGHQKMGHKKINLSTSLVKSETERAYLLAMPHNSTYDGYCFWFPKGLCRTSGEYCIILSIPDDFSFKLTKKDKSKQHNVIGSDTISAEDMVEELSDHQQRQEANDDGQSYLIVNSPKKKEIAKVDIPEELKNNG